MKNILTLTSAFLLCVSHIALAAPFLEKTNLYEEGKDGFASYRIPGIIVTAKGSVLAYCEARKYSGADEGEIEIHLRRSTDGGKIWSADQQIAHMGPRLNLLPLNRPIKRKPPQGQPDTQTVNNPVAIAGRDGIVHFIYCIEYQRAFYMRSEDDGVTWSKPVEITPVFEQYRSQLDWQRVATGPGHALQLHTGRLAVPFWMSATNRQNGMKGAAGVIYSDDNGATWHGGEIALRNGNEANLAELADGRVFITARNGDPRNRRMAAYSPDGATGWSQPEFIDGLLEPGCMAGMVSYAGTNGIKKPRLLFSNPNTDKPDKRDHLNRENVTVKASEDGGKTWPIIKLLQPGPSAYSDLAVLPNGTILCFYESGTPEGTLKHKRPWAYAQITLAHFNLEWLASGRDAGK